MGFSKSKLSRFVRAAVVSGLLGAAGLTITAAPAMAGGASDGASDGTSDGASDGASDGVDDGGTDGGTAGGTTAVGASDLGTDSLPLTGGNAAVPLALGGAAVGIVIVGRRLLASQA